MGSLLVDNERQAELWEEVRTGTMAVVLLVASLDRSTCRKAPSGSAGGVNGQDIGLC